VGGEERSELDRGGIGDAFDALRVAREIAALNFAEWEAMMMGDA
jgi:hypothetical protein